MAPAERRGGEGWPLRLGRRQRGDCRSPMGRQEFPLRALLVVRGCRRLVWAGSHRAGARDPARNQLPRAAVSAGAPSHRWRVASPAPNPAHPPPPPHSPPQHPPPDPPQPPAPPPPPPPPPEDPPPPDPPPPP